MARIVAKRHLLVAVVAVVAGVGLFVVAGAFAAPAETSLSSSRPAASVTAVTAASWNRHVSCRATVTSLARVLGTQRSSLGGATFAGGGFKPGIPNRRDITPPCSVSGVPTLVELDRVTLRSCQRINHDGDWTCTVTDPSASKGTVPNLNHMHIESDVNFRKAGWAQPDPPGGTLLDLQGFVYWDPNHTTAAWHNHSGWELHTLTAWRHAR